MLNLTKQSDYALLLLSRLGDKEKYVSLSELTKRTGLPKRFLARIAAELVKNKLIESKEGKVGGYKLLEKAKKISLYDFLKIFEGDLNFVKCCDEEYQCRWQSICPQKSFLRNRLGKIVGEELQKWQLADLLKLKSNL